MSTSTDATPFTRQLRALRQTRRFTDQPIADGVLDDILDVARWSGSSKNTQPWHFVIVTDSDDLETLSEAGQFAGFLAGAKFAIVIAMAGENPRSEPYDEGRVTERIMLAAAAHGLGSGTGWFAPGQDGEDRVKAALGIPEKMVVRQAVGLGHPDEGDQRARSVSGGRKPREEVVSFGRYGSTGRQG